MTRRLTPRRTRLAVAASLLTAVGLFAGIALAAVPVPVTPNFSEAIDQNAAYVGQSTCSPSEKPGAVGLRSLLLSTYSGTRNLGIIRDCSVGGTSEHKEGRAFDWGVNVSNATEKAEADALLGWLLATDKYGHKNAMARRLGVMYMIFNRQIWSAYNADAGWRPYTGSNAHIDHVHFSLSWDGADKRTTWWDPAAQASLNAALEAARTCPVPATLAAPTLDTDPSRLVAVQPVRLVDSRTGLGITGDSAGCRLAPQGRVDVKVTGVGGVPEDGSVSSVLLNVTQVNARSGSYLSAYPAGADWPGTSVVNASAGSTAAAGTSVPVGTDGKVSILNGAGESDLVVDLVGYYSTRDGATFVPVSPARAMDSRESKVFGDGETRTLVLAGKNGVPANAEAVVANVTVLGQNQASFVSVWPAGAPRPSTSSVNVAPRSTVPNRVVSGLGTDGAVQIFADRSAHVIVDVTGWFGGATGSEYHAMQPARVVDTRDGTGTGGSKRQVPAGGLLDVDLSGSVPAQATAAALTLTGTLPTAPTFVTAWPGGLQPNTSDLNLVTGGTAANMALQGLTGRHFVVRPDSADIHVIVDLTGWFGPALGDLVPIPATIPVPVPIPLPVVTQSP